MVVSTGWSWWHALGRRKVLDSLALGSSELARVLNTFDLTALGVGSTLGVGVYVLAGNVSKNIAGPAVVVSFLIAAVASLFAGLCYAEFGARVPRAGSAYIYSYVCVGEFVAFIIGWNLILEYVIGSASVARGLSKYLDSLLNETMEQTFLETMPMATGSLALSPYFDMFAFGISFILAVALSLGVKESSLVNNLFTIVNIAVVLFVILAGSFKADSKNWAIKKEDIVTDNPETAGEGGFFPFGVSGAIKGAATCFYGFVGFDCVATTGEEVRNPQKAIPIAIIVSLTIIFLSYFGVSTVLTLMWPYYLQDSDAPIPKVFVEIGWPVAQWIVTIGGIFGLCASLFGAMFPLPRIIYAMAMDGLIFRFLGQVHHYFKTPFYGTLIAGLLTGLMAAMFDLDQLVNMMSIGTLLAYTIVAACVLLLRYTDLELYGGSDIVSSEYIESTNLVSLREPVTFGTVSRQLFNPFRKKHPTFLSSSVVTAEVLVFGVLSTLLGLCVVFWERDLADLDPWALSVTSVIGGILVLILLSVSLQPTSSKPLSFKVPFVPVVPAMSILINIYLMLKLDGNTWIRFGVWMAIGFAIYFLYGMKKSKATNSNNLVRELQSAKSQLNEEPQSLRMEKGKIWLSGPQASADETDYKHPKQSIMTELDSPMIISGLNNGLILQHDSVMKQNLSSEMNNNDLPKSLAYIDDLERILDFNAEQYYNRKTTVTNNSVDYIIRHENKNSAITHNASFPSIGKSSVVSEATLSVVPELSASVMSSPADVSLSSEHTKTIGSKNHVKRLPSSRSARNLYPNVLVISYESDDDVTEQEKEGVAGQGKHGDNTEAEETRSVSSQTFFHRESVSDNQEYLAALKQNTNTEDSGINAELRKQSPTPPPLPPPPPPPPPLPPPFPPFLLSSPKTTSTSSNIIRETVSLEGDSNASHIRSNNERHVDIKSKTEPTTPITPDPKFLLRMGSLKTSDFASKLEAVLQEKIYDVKYERHKKPQLFTKNSTNTENSANTGKLKHHWSVVNIDANEQPNGTAENWNDSLAESNVIQGRADEQLMDREIELADIKGKLEQFFANRADASILPRALSHPNIASLASEMKHESDGAQLKSKQFPKEPLLNETEKLKVNDENNNFDTVRKQRLLMGEVLASLKFVANKEKANSESSISDASEEDEVFEELTQL